jgi:mycofactocin biosynthetic radical S-adenosylmethionine protein MftC
MPKQSDGSGARHSAHASTSGERRDSDGPLVLVPQYFGSTVFDRRTSKYMPFDKETTALLVRLQSEPFDLVQGQVQDLGYREQLANFFEHFSRLAFFTIERKLAGVVRDVEVPPDHLVGPLALHLEVVAACNLRCAHCFAGELPRREQPLTLSELDGLFATLSAIGTFRLGLTGGEPLLRHDLFEIIDLATAHGLCPCLTTNGLLITEEVAREFGKREMVWLNVSLEGATAETNDRVRGQGTFDRVIEKLSLLSKHARFTLAFTVMQTNLHEIQQCAELAHKVGAHTAVFRPLYPVGIAKHHLKLMPTFADYNSALNALSEVSRRYDFEVCSIDPFSPRTREDSQSIIYENFGCGAGNIVCSVSVSGEVNPCSFLGPEHVAANIRDTPFQEIWHDSQGFRHIRALPGGDGQFSGGCRARALVFNGSINAADPWVASYTEEARPHDGLGPMPAPIHHPLTILQLTARGACKEKGSCTSHEHQGVSDS